MSVSTSTYAAEFGVLVSSAVEKLQHPANTIQGRAQCTHTRQLTRLIPVVPLVKTCGSHLCRVLRAHPAKNFRAKVTL